MADPDCLKCLGPVRVLGMLWRTQVFPCYYGMLLDDKTGLFPQTAFEAYVQKHGMLGRDSCPFLGAEKPVVQPATEPKPKKGFRRVGGSRYGFTLIELLIVLAIVAIVATIFIPALINYYEKKNAPPAPLTALQPVTRISNWDGEVREKLREVCVSGHVYYFADIDSGFGDANTRAIIFAPKLDDDGKPVKCGPELEKEK